MTNSTTHISNQNLASKPHPWLRRTRLWQMTSRRERLLALVSLILTIPSVYVLAQNAIVSQRMSGQIRCLAMNIYHEARGEPIAGQYAVAEVTLNRTHSREFPATVCQVVYQKLWNPRRKENVYAFSWTGMHLRTNFDSAAWRQAWQIARNVLTDEHTPTLRGALYYHSIDVDPAWAHHHKELMIIGRHIFYL